MAISKGDRVYLNLGREGALRGRVVDVLLPGTYGLPHGVKVDWDSPTSVDASVLEVLEERVHTGRGTGRSVTREVLQDRPVCPDCGRRVDHLIRGSGVCVDCNDRPGGGKRRHAKSRPASLGALVGDINKLTR